MNQSYSRNIFFKLHFNLLKYTDIMMESILLHTLKYNNPCVNLFLN